MSLFLTMLPVYLFGNLHCLGMCGPLVFMLSKHRFRYFYFLGRLTSFTLGGMIAGAFGSVLNFSLKEYHIQPIACFLFGFVALILGLSHLFHEKRFKMFLVPAFILKKTASINHFFSTLMLKDLAFSTFLFGFFTIALPCGQTLFVFSACALSGDFLVGMLNGAAFALLTSPSLFFAMQANRFFLRFKQYYHPVIGISALFIGSLSLCRGLAELDLIDHFILNPNAPLALHIVIY